MSNKTMIVLGVALAAAMVGVMTAGSLFSTRRGPVGPAEELMEDRLYTPNGVYHVADLQARPGVQAALGRLREAKICDLYYQMRTGRMSDNVKRTVLCGMPTDPDLPKLERGVVDFEDREMHPTIPPPSRFAVFSGTDGTQYLIADGKNGSVSADEMEKIVVTVIDNAIANLSAATERARKREAEYKASRDAAAEAQRRAQESFK